MARELIISVSGMRGIIGENLSAEIAAAYGCAFGAFLKGEAAGEERLAVCIGRDSRPSGQMIYSGVAAGLCSVGVDVVDLGVVSTPGVGIMLRRLGCAGGVVITASHNPVEYNGIKLLLGNGIAPPPVLAEKIRGIYFDKAFKVTDSLGCGGITTNDATDEVHIEKVMAIIDADSIAARKFSVVLDSVNGAGGRSAIKMLERLGCDVVGMNIEPTGVFAHTPEPTADNLGGLCEEVKRVGADIGFAQDPDADRLAIVDAEGTYIGEEYTLALAAKLAFGARGGKAAANLSTSRMIDDIASAAGGEVIRTPVGEANVAQAMIDSDCIIGGEGNGGVIDLRIGPIRDSLVAMAFVLQLMADADKTIAELVGEIGAYHADANIDTSDGCRFDFDDGWVHLRTSNTEPIMRAIVETQTPEAAEKYLEVVDKIRDEVI
jgi:phosphomannomutase